jgi:NTE family protein
LDADGVFRGGGVKAIGIVGALAAMAEHPTKPVQRWVNLAGSSAGAIVAALLAVGTAPRELEALVLATDLGRFEDFGPLGRWLGGAWNLVRRHGLLRGRYLEDWLDERLGGKTFAALDGRLKLVAVDVTNRALLVLPDDLLDASGAPQWRDPASGDDIHPDSFPIARAVRMSVSVPYVFPPVELVWKPTGKRATILDGGTLSNFPVWLFDVDAPPVVRPTIGITLSGGRNVAGGLERVLAHAPWPVALGGEIVETALEAWDRRFATHSTRVRTCVVPADGFAATDFGITTEQKRSLLAAGHAAATAFLDTFDPAAYRNSFGHALAHPSA